jgi:hypothetical protein
MKVRLSVLVSRCNNSPNSPHFQCLPGLMRLPQVKENRVKAARRMIASSGDRLGFG